MSIEITKGVYKAKEGGATFKVLDVNRQTSVVTARYRLSDGTPKEIHVTIEEFSKLIDVDLTVAREEPKLVQQGGRRKKDG